MSPINCIYLDMQPIGFEGVIIRQCSAPPPSSDASTIPHFLLEQMPPADDLQNLALLSLCQS